MDSLSCRRINRWASGRALAHRRNSGFKAIDYYMHVCPVGADLSENQAKDWPVTLETPVVRVRESERA